MNNRIYPLIPLGLNAPLVIGLAIGLVALASTPARAALTPEQRAQERDKLPWLTGPSQAAVGERAVLKLPNGMRLLPEAHGARFLELTGNLPSPGHTILANPRWWAVFSYSDVGYVKDDENLDADALLRSLKENDKAENEQRRDRGIAALTTEGWAVPPHFDAGTKRLEWGLRLRAEGDTEPTINYTVRVLGRSGYESVTLVTDAESLQAGVAELRTVLKGFDFNNGESYAEFKPGDRVAEFGLGALILGTGAAAAIKSGWFKGLLAALVAGWKLVAAAVVALFALVGRLMGGKRSSSN